MNLPEDIANQSLDAAAIDFTIGNMSEGTRPAQVLLRAYGQCLRQLLRAANWDFARKTIPMTLLADATGNTPAVGTNVILPWIFEYEYPIDCMKARFVPWNRAKQEPGIPSGNITPPDPAAPLMTGLSAPYVGQRMVPARFLVATDSNYPPPPTDNPDQLPQGVSPASRTVICTNVPMAHLVYTALMLYPNTWDGLFRAALVAYLASEIALPLSKDKKFGRQIRADNIAIAKAKIQEARLADGNEAFTSSNIPVDWMLARRTGARFGGWGSGDFDGGVGPGFIWGANDACTFADGTAY